VLEQWPRFALRIGESHGAAAVDLNRLDRITRSVKHERRRDAAVALTSFPPSTNSQSFPDVKLDVPLHVA
jgi:hypothetical protein